MHYDAERQKEYATRKLEQKNRKSKSVQVKIEKALKLSRELQNLIEEIRQENQ